MIDGDLEIAVHDKVFKARFVLFEQGKGRMSASLRCIALLINYEDINSFYYRLCNKRLI